MTPSMTGGHVYLASSPQGTAFPAMVERALADATAKLPPGRRKPKVAISYAAVADSLGGRTFMKGYAMKTFWGAEVHAFHVAGEPSRMEPAKAEAIVAEADLVFLSGGDPVLGARLLRESGADAWLRAARARGTACMGISAGAIMLCAYWAEWPDEPPPGAPWDGGKLVQCAGVVDDLVVDCHAEADHWAELKLVRGMIDARAHPSLEGGAPTPRLRGIPAGAGLVIGPSGETEWLGASPFVG